MFFFKIELDIATCSESTVFCITSPAQLLKSSYLVSPVHCHHLINLSELRWEIENWLVNLESHIQNFSATKVIQCFDLSPPAAPDKLCWRLWRRSGRQLWVKVDAPNSEFVHKYERRAFTHWAIWHGFHHASEGRNGHEFKYIVYCFMSEHLFLQVIDKLFNTMFFHNVTTDIASSNLGHIQVHNLITPKQ